MIVIGTSLVVYPAAGLIDFAQPGIPKFMVDPSAPEMRITDEWEYLAATAKDGVPKLKKELIENFT